MIVDAAPPVTPPETPRRSANAVRKSLLALIQLSAILGLLTWLFPAMLARTNPALVMFIHAFSLLGMLSTQMSVATLLVALACFLFRQRQLALAATLLALLWAIPDMAPIVARFRPTAPEGFRVRVYSVNTCYGIANTRTIAGDLQRFQPDIVMVQESTPSFQQRFQPMVRDYPYRIELPEHGAFGQAVYSKLPFTKQPIPYAGTEVRRITQVLITVAGPEGESLTLVNVHTLPPIMLDYIVIQREHLRALRGLASGATADNPMVFAGDFNASPRSSVMRAVMRGRLRDGVGHRLTSRAGTWPAFGLNANLGKLQLDNILISNSLDVSEAALGTVNGSDHLPVFAEVVVPRTPQP